MSKTKRLINPSAMSAKQVAEEKFRVQDLEGAIIFATMAKKLDPRMDGIDEALIAYKVHLAASKKRSNGETDWYKVLGIREGFADIDSIKKQHSKLAAMVNPTKNDSVATAGAFRLINQAWSILSDPNKRRLAFSNQQAHASSAHVDFRLMKGSGSIKADRKACPRCRRWCKYEKPKRSNRHKHGDPKSVLQLTCPSCRCKFDPISGKTPNSRFSLVQ